MTDGPFGGTVCRDLCYQVQIVTPLSLREKPCPSRPLVDGVFYNWQALIKDDFPRVWLMLKVVADVVQEYHKHPFFTLVFALCVLGGGWFVWVQSARAGDVEELKTDVADLGVDVFNIQVLLQRNDTEKEIRDLSREIFELENLRDNGNINQEQLGRLRDLQIDLNQARVELSRIPNLREKKP